MRSPSSARAQFISLSSPVYAERLVDRIVHRFEQARRHPRSGRTVPEYQRDDLRELIEYPYRLVYRIQSSHLEIIAILHGRQDFRLPSDETDPSAR